MGSQHVSSFRCRRPRIDGTGRKTAYRRAMTVAIRTQMPMSCPAIAYETTDAVASTTATASVPQIGSHLDLREPLFDLLTHSLISAGTLIVLEDPVADRPSGELINSITRGLWVVEHFFKH